MTDELLRREKKRDKTRKPQLLGRNFPPCSYLPVQVWIGGMVREKKTFKRSSWICVLVNLNSGENKHSSGHADKAPYSETARAFIKRDKNGLPWNPQRMWVDKTNAPLNTAAGSPKSSRTWWAVSERSKQRQPSPARGRASPGGAALPASAPVTPLTSSRVLGGRLVLLLLLRGALSSHSETGRTRSGPFQAGPQSPWGTMSPVEANNTAYSFPKNEKRRYWATD